MPIHSAAIPAARKLIFCLSLCLIARLSPAQPNYSGLFLANQNTTGATQTPLSLGNWSSPTTVPSVTFNTWDNGTSYLEMHSTRWGGAFLFTRSDPSGNSYDLMQAYGYNGVGSRVWLYDASNNASLQLNGGGVSYFAGGNVLIGKTSQTNTSYVLDVNGPARANQVVVNTTGADYVFDPAYRLTPLTDLAAYLKQQHHLPGILSAAQMQQQGLDLGDNQTRLLAKIEELTLYVIEQDKRSATLEEEVQRLKARNQTLEDLEKRLERLERSTRSN